MGNMIKIIQLALGLVPSVIDVVKAIELPGSGIEKKNAVIEIVTAAVKVFAPEYGVKIETIGSFVSMTIDIIVTLLNATSVFKKNLPAPE